MTDELEGLDPEIESLLRSERVDAAVPAAAVARLRSRIDRSIAVGDAHDLADGPASGVARHAASPLWRTLLPVATLVVGGAIGAGVQAMRAPAIVYVDRTVVLPSVSAPRATLPVTPPAPLPEVVPERVAPAPSTTHGRVFETEAQQLAQERRAIDDARAALGAGDTTRALGVLDEHARAFPRGILREEREALSVRALARAGRGAEAKTRAEAFHKQFPQSLFASGVDAEVDRIP
jgi:hypothetical protein